MPEEELPFDLKEVNPFLLIGASLFVGIIIGVIGMNIYIESNNDSTNAVLYFENLLRDIPRIRPNMINEKSSIGYLSDFYFRYGFVTRELLIKEMSGICNDWNQKALMEKIPKDNYFNETLNNFCSEVCTK